MPDETKEEKSLRLANYRLEKAVDRIRTLHKLAANRYSYSEAQVDYILSTLDKEVQALEDAFKGGPAPAAVGLPDC